MVRVLEGFAELAEPVFKKLFPPGARDIVPDKQEELARPWIEGGERGKAPALMHGEPHELLELERGVTSDGEDGLERLGELEGCVQMFEHC
jgi:hypothetical protein